MVFLDDIMRYYYFNFIMVYCLFLVVIIATFSAFRQKQFIGSIVLSTIAGVGMFSHFYFIGVLADNRAPGLEIWGTQAIVIACASLALWIFQWVGLYRNQKDK